MTEKDDEGTNPQTPPPGAPLTWLDLAREVFPGRDDGFLDYVLWEHTGFPEFWNIPEDGATPAACCRAQLERYRDFGAACYRCGAYGTGKHGQPYVKYRSGIPFCRPCVKLFDAESEAALASGATAPTAPPSASGALAGAEELTTKEKK